MNGFMEGIAVAMVPMAGIGVMLVILCTVTYIWELITGDAKLPRFLRKKKSPRIPHGLQSSGFSCDRRQVRLLCRPCT